MVQGKRVFQVTFRCENCNNECTIDYPKKTVVKEKAMLDGSGPFATHPNLSDIMKKHSDEWGFVNCPNCETSARYNSIIDRSPIE